MFAGLSVERVSASASSGAQPSLTAMPLPPRFAREVPVFKSHSSLNSRHFWTSQHSPCRPVALIAAQNIPARFRLTPIFQESGYVPVYIFAHLVQCV
jgi:hypothetical protein